MLINLNNETATLALGEAISKNCPDNAFTIHLEGDLGAGKTTLTRGILNGLGHTGHVKSPTYTLVEQYLINTRTIYHFDLYRLTDPEELEYIGLEDYLGDNALCLIEWPALGGHYLPTPDLTISLQYQKDGRQVTLTPMSDAAQALYHAVRQIYPAVQPA
ncbi:MAG: tRNA threonylcarbamoyladenosine biosynthesis protein TsaE [Methylophagaceae bacterium]|jgi:tRNA threonylcarbamoyladenosine biosynthesis protein TsaE